LPYPERGSGAGLDSSGGYKFTTTNQDTGEQWWSASYWGCQTDSDPACDAALIPYTPNVLWVDGDRQGYKCMYGFIGEDLNADGDLSVAEIDGRFLLNAVNGAAYSKVIDTYMNEAVRYLDGSLANSPGNELTDEDCQPQAEPYVPYAGPDERPRVGFWSDNYAKPLDIRDYTNTVALADIKFHLLEWTDEEAIVGAYLDSTDLPVFFIYYTGMNGGLISVEME